MAVLAVGVPLGLVATSAQALQTGPGVQAGHNITVFPDLDFVAVNGYDFGQVLTVEVVRHNAGTGRDETIGRVTAPAMSFRDGDGLEINHGPLGTAVPGDCWDVQTPDVRPGDRIVVTADAQTDEITVDDIMWTSTPTLAANGDVVIDGVARRADGTPIAASALDGGEFRNTTGKYRINPDLVEQTGTAGQFRVHYRAPYTGFRNRDNLTEEQRRTALLTENQHSIGYGHTVPLPAETQLRNGLADLSGPALGCEAAPAGTTPLSGTDATPPAITARTPDDGAVGVSPGTAVTATFSEDVTGVDGTSVTLRDATGPVTGVTVGYDPTTRVATLQPTSPLETATAYTVSVTGNVRDGAGNPLPATSWTFTTAASTDTPPPGDTPPADTTPPALVGTAPGADAVDVAPDARVDATFSEEVTGVGASTLTLAGPDGPVAAAVTWDAGTRTATLRPTAPLALGSTYTASLSAAITDTAGNPLPNSSWSFRTRPAPDTVAPAVVDLSPADGAAGVPQTGTVTATFGEDVTGVTGGFTLAGPSGAPVPAGVRYDAATRVATLTPDAPLAASTTYTATVEPAITDAAGNPVASTSWTFTTATAAPPADTAVPTVTARTPADGATGVAADSSVTVAFSEPVINVDVASLTLTGPAGVPVPATVTYDAERRVATLTPAVALMAGSAHTAALTNAITDIAGNRLASTSWSFTTAGTAPRDTTAPAVVSRGPADGATGVARGTLLQATFSEAVKGMRSKTFTLTGPTGAVRATVDYNATTRVAVLTPSSVLSAGTRYTAALTDAITDNAGNRLTPTTWSFTTVSTASTDTVAPAITARTPAVDASGVRRRNNISVTFSEPVTGVGGATMVLRTSAGAAVAAGVRYDATKRVATLDPAATLQANSRYQVSLTTGIADAAGNPLATTDWTFTTGRN